MVKLNSYIWFRIFECRIWIYNQIFLNSIPSFLNTCLNVQSPIPSFTKTSLSFQDHTRVLGLWGLNIIIPFYLYRILYRINIYTTRREQRAQCEFWIMDYGLPHYAIHNPHSNTRPSLRDASLCSAWQATALHCVQHDRFRRFTSFSMTFSCHSSKNIGCISFFLLWTIQSIQYSLHSMRHSWFVYL